MKGFREFLARGNVIDLAVAVVIGTAFTAIVTALVADIITPLIAAVFNANSIATALVIGIPTTSGGTSNLMLGAFIAAVINFLIVAAVVYFVFVLPYTSFINRRNARKAAAAGPEEPAAPTQEELLTQIRDLLAKGAYKDDKHD